MTEPSRLKQLHRDVVSTLRDDEPMQDDPAKFDGLRRFTHFWALVGTFFWRNRCQVRASALAYTTLLALVPLLAVSISMLVVFKSGDSEARISDWIEQLVHNVAPQLGLSDKDGGDTARHNVVGNILAYVGNIRFGTIGVTAMAGLVFVAISLMRTIEAAFNDIWGVTKARSWWSSILLYWGVLTLGPAVLAIVLTSSYVGELSDSVEVLRSVPVLGLLKTAMLPLVTLTAAFGLFYLLMPNTRVDVRAAFVGGAIAALLWWANSKLGAVYNTKVVTYSKIYGSLGAVPLFLLGLYFSWMILLFGSQVAYVYQNRAAYLQEKQAEKIHQLGREFAAVRLVTEIARRFARDEPPASAATLSRNLGVPPRLARQILKSFADGRLLNETSGADPAYVPAKPLEQISVQSVLTALRTANGTDLATTDDPVRAVVRRELSAIRGAESAGGSSLSLADLVAKI